MTVIVLLTAESLLAQAAPQVVAIKNDASLDAQRERHAVQSLLRVVEKEILSAVDAMPADKFGFAPSAGEFKAVRTLGQMLKQFSSSIHLLIAAPVGEE